MNETEILDLLEDVCIGAAKKVLEQSGFPITREQARNLVGKIGTRITFSSSLGKERTDEIIMSAPKNK